MNVFQLTAVELDDEPSRDGSRGTFLRDLGVFTSVENAEEMMRRFVERGNYGAPWAFEVRERILDDLAPHGPFGKVSGFRSVRTYFGDGTLNAANDCDDTGEKRWFGRDAATIRFRRGDFVSVWAGGSVYPALVGEIPFTPDRFPKGSQGFEADDDCYLVYTADGGHDHPFTPYVFPLVGTLPDDVRAKIEAARDREESADA